MDNDSSTITYCNYVIIMTIFPTVSLPISMCSCTIMHIHCTTSHTQPQHTGTVQTGFPLSSEWQNIIRQLCIIIMADSRGVSDVHVCTYVCRYVAIGNVIACNHHDCRSIFPFFLFLPRTQPTHGFRICTHKDHIVYTAIQV